jgi:hypothetical protein
MIPCNTEGFGGAKLAVICGRPREVEQAQLNLVPAINVAMPVRNRGHLTSESFQSPLSRDERAPSLAGLCTGNWRKCDCGLNGRPGVGKMHPLTFLVVGIG